MFGHAQAVIDGAIASLGIQAGGARISAAGTPVMASVTFGLLRSGWAMNARQSVNVPGVASGRPKALVDQAFVTTTCASAVMSATLVPGAAAGGGRRADVGRLDQINAARVGRR